MGKLNVDGTEIQVLQIEEDDYISLTDMVRKIVMLEIGLNRFIMSVKNGYPVQIPIDRIVRLLNIMWTL